MSRFIFVLPLVTLLAACSQETGSTTPNAPAANVPVTNAGKDALDAAGKAVDDAAKKTANAVGDAAGKVVDAAKTATNNLPGGLTADGVASQVADLLAGIKDSAGAQAAVAKLEPLVTQLGGLLKAVPGLADGQGGAGGAASDLANKAAAALAPNLKTAIDRIKGEVTRLSGNAEVLGPVKSLVEKLSGLLPK